MGWVPSPGHQRISRRSAQEVQQAARLYVLLLLVLTRRPIRTATRRGTKPRHNGEQVSGRGYSA